MATDRLTRFSLVLLVAASAVTLSFFVLNYAVVGYDAFFHMTNLDQYISLRNSGITLPRWTPLNYRNFGSATYYFYPPLVSILGSALYPLTSSLEATFNLLSLLMTALAVATCRFYLVLLNVPRNRLWFASLLYAIGPYMFFDAIIRSAFAEYYSLAWIPLLLAGIEISLGDRASAESMRRHLFASESIQGLVLSSLAWTLLVLTSIPMSAAVALCAPLYVAARLRRGQLPRVMPLLFGGVLSIVCLGFYLLPILHFRSSVHLGHVFTITSERPFEEFALAHVFRVSHGSEALIDLLMLPASLFLCVLWYRNWRRERSRLSCVWLVLTGLVVVMHLPPLAGPLARNIPLLGLVQFPSRFYIFSALSLAVWMANSQSGWQKGNGAVLISCSSLGVLVLAGYVVIAQRGAGHFPMDRQLRWNAYEYAPIQTLRNADSLKQYAFVHSEDPEISSLSLLSPTETLTTIGRNGLESKFLVSLADTHTVRLHRFYWPEWILTTSTGLDIKSSYNSEGALIATLPAGRYYVYLNMRKSEVEGIGEIISLIGVGFWCLLAAFAAFGAGRRIANINPISVSAQTHKMDIR